MAGRRTEVTAVCLFGWRGTVGFISGSLQHAVAIATNIASHYAGQATRDQCQSFRLFSLFVPSLTKPLQTVACFTPANCAMWLPPRRGITSRFGSEARESWPDQPSDASPNSPQICPSVEHSGSTTNTLLYHGPVWHTRAGDTWQALVECSEKSVEGKARRYHDFQ